MGFNPREFQQETIARVTERLFDERGVPGSRRFLVADEVGLGKTIVAREVVQALKRKRKRPRVVYITSSLDIASQNREKLVKEGADHIVASDRILLAFRELSLRRRGSCGLELLSFTPSTSIFIRRHLGTAEERRFIALLCMKYCGARLSWASRVFCQLRSEESFESFKRGLAREFHERLAFDGTLRKRIREAIHGVEFFDSSKNKVRFADLINQKIESEMARLAVKEVRQALSRMFLAELRADLVIVDEFQRCGGLITWDVREEVKPLFSGRTSVLLLSATPYTLVPSLSAVGGIHEGARHYEDFERILNFLSERPEKVKEILKLIGEYGKKVSSFESSNLTPLLEMKASIETWLGRYVSRIERVMYEGYDTKAEPVLLSDWADRNGETYHPNQLANFLGMKGAVESPSTLLLYWKSGAFPLSYMQDYQLVKRLKNSKVRMPSLALSDKTKSGTEHLKLRYLMEEFVGNGAAFNELWIKASKPYYDSQTVFASNTSGRRKALLFSVWKFVPKFVSTELALLRNKHFHGSATAENKRRHTIIKVSNVTWARFFYPSQWLSRLLKHEDFIRLADLGQIRAFTRNAVVESLESNGFRVKNTVGALSAWEVLRKLDVETLPFHKELVRFYERGERHGAHGEHVFPPKEIRLLKSFPDGLHVRSSTVDDLVDIAIGSPSVCLLRAFESLFGRSLTEIEAFDLMKFCLHVPRSFINRPSSFEAARKVFKLTKSPSDRMMKYFIDGGIQAVLDEYLYVLGIRNSVDPVREVLTAFESVWGPIKNSSNVELRGEDKSLRVSNDFAVSFAGGNLEADSRDNIRRAFNSPFWPLVLATTSVGQEGLDFHLYCRDIIHWDLPSNPVAFEQREGRINRFNNINVRANISKAVSPLKPQSGTHIWEYLFSEARFHSSCRERFSNGLSPNWIFAPERGSPEKILRHVMDLPLSKDRQRYERLMRDVIHYRLALGQPNQIEFLQQIRRNSNLENETTVKALTIDLSPGKGRVSEFAVNEILGNERLLKKFVTDVRAYLGRLRHHTDYGELKSLVQQHVLALENECSRRSAKALLYFLRPNDSIHDDLTEIGLSDDIDELRKAG